MTYPALSGMFFNIREVKITIIIKQYKDIKMKQTQYNKDFKYLYRKEKTKKQIKYELLTGFIFVSCLFICIAALLVVISN